MGDRIREQARSHKDCAEPVGAGLLAKAPVQAPNMSGGLDDFQPNLVLTQQLRQRRHRLLIGHQAINQADRP